MILDTIFIQAAYILAYMVWNGLENLYATQLYLNIGVILFLIGICAGLSGKLQWDNETGVFSGV